jgi:hypothetical protein
MAKREDRRLLTLADGISARTAIVVLEALVSAGETAVVDPETRTHRMTLSELEQSSPVLRPLSDGIGVYVGRYSRLS